MTPSRSLLTALCLALTLGATGCSGSGGNDSAPSSSSGTPAAASSESPTPVPTLTADSGKSASTYIKDTFSSAAWAKSISSITVADNKLSASTKLGTSKQDKATAREICKALSGYQVTNEGGFQGVVVKGKDDKVIIDRSSLSKSC